MVGTIPALLNCDRIALALSLSLDEAYEWRCTPSAVLQTPMLNLDERKGGRSGPRVFEGTKERESWVHSIRL